MGSPREPRSLGLRLGSSCWSGSIVLEWEHRVGVRASCWSGSIVLEWGHRVGVGLWCWSWVIGLESSCWSGRTHRADRGLEVLPPGAEKVLLLQLAGGDG
eukprot:3210375-Prymnesium_polylepis.1